ncbi:conserved Plasmodium protein, unknown function [Plasmodium knowlesi strain H]|uniref:Uncharacterized protein n=2 Tax=Plasmodium knowlesi TaxID=5850 RepID=A0A679KU87_PLAKH|nr:conserved Plasmodium protein, unknown function [Plasmodium knowlesi strain H]OTN65852.1 Uncharacterized protein PKNOH_S100055400 [Plasmodium knowlesi]CAA9987911.1 conserved Plasmodium protein, unknown function [Plasmodium knowlesi strain H]VVS77385.1 conserved Plasmodium protein, unknown function [Plasmodium knowlesi strain H]
MDHHHCVQCSNFMKEKKKDGRSSHLEKLPIDVNGEKFRQDFKGYLRNVNQSFLHSRHEVFSACNWSNLKRVLADYGSSDVVKSFNARLACARSFRLELTESYKMHKEDQYMESTLERENHIRQRKLKERHYEQMEKQMFVRNQREYRDLERKELQNKHEAEKQKMQDLVKSMIHAAFKMEQMETTYGDSYFYNTLFSLEKSFFMRQIKNMSELAQNNTRMNELTAASTPMGVFEEGGKKEGKKGEKEQKMERGTAGDKSTESVLQGSTNELNFLKCQGIVDSFFHLDLRNVSGTKLSTGKRAYSHMLAYLANQGEMSGVNRKELHSEHPNIRYGKRYSNYREKMLEGLPQVDWNYVKEKMGDKHFSILPMDIVEEKVKELPLLKSLLLKLFKKSPRESYFWGKYKLPLKIAITGKIKKDAERLAEKLSRTFPLKVYDVDKIEEDVQRICTGGSNHDDPSEEITTHTQKNKQRIARKIKRIAQTLRKKNYEEKNRDSLYADLLYYIIKYDYDLFHVSKRGRKRKGLVEVSPNEETENSKRKKYRGYIIINFFYSLKQYVLFELKAKKFFIYNDFLHEHVHNLKRRKIPREHNVPHINQPELERKKGDSKKGVNYACRKTSPKEKNKHSGEKKQNGKVGTEVSTLPNDSDVQKEEEATTEQIRTHHMEKENILFFSNFICNIDDSNSVKGRHHFSGATDLHFHVDRSNKEMNRILFGRITKGEEIDKAVREEIDKAVREENKSGYMDGSFSPKISPVFVKLKRINTATGFRRESDTEIGNSQSVKKRKKHTMKCRIVSAKKVSKKGKDEKDTKCIYSDNQTVDPDEEKFRSNLHLMRGIFQMDRNCQEVEAFLKAYEGGSTYPRFNLLRRHQYKSVCLLVSKILHSGRGRQMRMRRGGEVSDFGGGISEEDAKMDSNFGTKRGSHPGGDPIPRRIDSHMATYFKLRYCNIIKEYVCHLFNLFVWKENLKKNVEQTIQHIHRNMHMFTDNVNFESINEIIQSYNRLRASGIKNKKVELVLCKEINTIMIKTWLHILKGKNDSRQKEKVCIQKWIDMQMFLLIFFSFYLISIEHELYLKMSHFVNEMVYCLLSQEEGSASKNEKEKHFLIFNYFPKSKKDFYTFEGDNYHFPFVQNVREDVRKFLTEHLNGRSSNKARSDESSDHDSLFHTEHEKNIFRLAKEFHFLSTCKFVYKFNCLLNETVSTLRAYFFIFHDLKNYVNDFITLHYFIIYKQVNLACARVKRAIESDRHINFFYAGRIRKRKEKRRLRDGNGKRSEWKKPSSGLVQPRKGDTSVNTACKSSRRRRRKKKCNIKNEEHPFFNITEMKQSFRNNITFTFLKNIRSYIFLEHHSVIISRGDLQNAITKSLLFVKDKTEQVNISTFIGGTMLDAYFKERSVSPQPFLLRESRKNYDNDSPSCVFPDTEGKQNRYVFFPDFFFFLLFFFFKKEGHHNYIHKIFQNYFNVLEEKMTSKGELSGSKRLEVLRGCLPLWTSLTDVDSPHKGGSLIEQGVTGRAEKSEEKYDSEDAKNIFSEDAAKHSASQNCAEKDHLNNTQKKKKKFEESIDYFTFEQFAALGLFDFAKDTQKKLTKEERKKENYEIHLLNKFVFNFLYSLSLFPNFYEHVKIYVRKYLLKKNTEMVSSFEKCVMERMKSTEGRGGSVHIAPAQTWGKEIQHLRKGQDNSTTLFNTKKKKVRVKEILIFFHTSYQYDS